MKRSKRFSIAKAKVDRDQELNVEDAVKLLYETSTAKFDESIEVTLNLGIDPRRADQNIRGTVSLPFGTGKTVRVLVFAQGPKETEAKEAGADYVGFKEYVEKIKSGWLEFDSVIATPDMMREVGKLGKILGPRGMMPNPKSGTVTMEVQKAVKEIKAGKIEIRADKTGIVHSCVGKKSFSPENMVENIISFTAMIVKLKPSAAKGTYIKKFTLSSTMGPGIKLNRSDLMLRLHK